MKNSDIESYRDFGGWERETKSRKLGKLAAIGSEGIRYHHHDCYICWEGLKICKYLDLHNRGFKDLRTANCHPLTYVIIDEGFLLAFRVVSFNKFIEIRIKCCYASGLLKRIK